MKVIYIAGKYTAATKEERQKHIDAAEEAGKFVALEGNVPIIPHRISAHWDDDPRFQDWPPERWLTHYCFPMLAKCDEIMMLPGWNESKGAGMEYNYAEQNGIPISFYHPAYRNLTKKAKAGILPPYTTKEEQTA